MSTEQQKFPYVIQIGDIARYHHPLGYFEGEVVAIDTSGPNIDDDGIPIDGVRITIRSEKSDEVTVYRMFCNLIKKGHTK